MWKRSPARAPRMVASSSAPIPVKMAQYDVLHWQAADKDDMRVTGRRSVGASVPHRRFAAMTVGTRQSRFRDVLNEEDHGVTNVTLRKQVPRHFGRKAARKTEASDSDSNDDSNSPSLLEFQSSDDDSDWESVPDSDKEDAGSDSDDSIEILEFRPPPPIEILDDTPPASPALIPRLIAPPDEILAAMEEGVLPLTCLQLRRRLPFLQRNLRQGFLGYCRQRGVPTQVDDGTLSVQVCLKLAHDRLSHRVHITKHECPICALHAAFPTREMLEVHLTRDHDEVLTTWQQVEESNWRLEILLQKQPVIARSPSVPLVGDFEALRIAAPERPPTPPGPLGPTARFPFLPADSEHGGPSIKYSSRFGGPKIYDLLATLPMAEYGVLKWSVEDREEEIFEADDLFDEHKVMHALWARWIFARRNFFIAHYFKGAKQFVEDNWKMIRRAAGWEALRYFLLLLLTGKFLSGAEVAKLLNIYSDLCMQ
ncbi:hypothetical protein FB45DRAFT_893355 [Roridomyces roridus]|uniref:Uncharacterized protein n=1 Tax=Roridomyces roridus TaxID=1738132 RepID=A0AAD7FWW5_9AGAR|nr:hypothetical protein FB45DRAFT_893355 [Roridomyces roridus]